MKSYNPFLIDALQEANANTQRLSVDFVFFYRALPRPSAIAYKFRPTVPHYASIMPIKPFRYDLSQ